MYVCACRSLKVHTYTLYSSYLHATPTLRLRAADADDSSGGSEKQVQSHVYAQLAERCESGSSGAEPAWHRQGRALCTKVSDEELLIPADTPQQTSTGSKPQAQPNLLAVPLLSSPGSKPALTPTTSI